MLDRRSRCPLLGSDLPFSGDIEDKPKFGAHLAVPARQFQRLDSGPSCVPKDGDYEVYRGQYSLSEMDDRRICSSTTVTNEITRLTDIARSCVQDLSDVNRKDGSRRDDLSICFRPRASRIDPRVAPGNRQLSVRMLGL